MGKRLFSKVVWKDAIGATRKAKRLKLVPDDKGLFTCPVRLCDSEKYRSKRGCRKHVFNRHGWYYFFDEKPDIDKVFPSLHTRTNTYKLPQRVKTSNMPMFLKNCTIGQSFKKWLQSPGGGGKMESQADQILCKILKYFKFCCTDVLPSWDIPESAADYCLGSLVMMSDFIEHLQKQWHLGYSGIIGYMNAIGHMLDYRRSCNNFEQANVSVFIATEIYLQRVKRYLSKKMKIHWNNVLSVDYLNSIKCWASLEDLQKVIPFHSNRYKQIILNASSPSTCISAHDLSFTTSFIVAVLFLMVKASRPMTYQYLTVQMIKSVGENGIINQTVFKTNEKYGFDSLIFSVDVLTLINNYIDIIRPRFNPVCDFLLVCRNGNQISKLSDIFGRIVFQAIGKYINPTRYRQIIETESAEKLTSAEQANISDDQKHTSNVAKIHYQKLKSQDVAMKAKSCLDKLRDASTSSNQILDINSYVNNNSNTHSKNIVNDTPAHINCARQKKTPFSDIEDNFIKEGVNKYGYGQWTSILNDKSFVFHPSRKVSTLAVRAKKIIRLKTLVQRR